MKKSLIPSHSSPELSVEDLSVLKKVIERAWEAFWIERDGCITYLSPSFEVLTAYPPEPYLGPSEDFHALMGAITEVVEVLPHKLSRESAGLYRLIRRDGEIRYVRSRTVQAGPAESLGLLEDLTQEHLDREQLRYLASYDELTGVHNRRTLEEFLEKEGRQGSIGVLFMDLDRFKEANDAYGHVFGDEILRAFVQRLDCLLPASSCIARVGGDEFAVAIRLDKPGQEAAMLQEISDRILASCQEPIGIDGTEILCGVSIGSAWSPPRHGMAAELLVQADLAMYRTKKSGCWQAVAYSSDMGTKLHRKLYLSRELVHALERDQIRVHYQPQWSLEDRSLLGFEALARWYHPELGEISPLEFIPIAESSYLIHLIGEFVLMEACARMQDLNSSFGTRVKVAVNVSAVQLQKPDFIPVLRRILIDTEFPPELLELEVTETCLMDDSPRSLRVLQSLRNLGLGLSLDDFGTEYASFNYLQQFELNKLKVDKLFVQRFLENPNTSSIVGTIIQLGRNLGMRVLAEGVESAVQARGLRDLGCQEVQGFYFAEPQEAEAIAAFFPLAHRGSAKQQEARDLRS